MTQSTYFPQAILAVNRQEISPDKPLKLNIKKQLTEEETTLPEDLQGVVFTIAPVGSVASATTKDQKSVLPASDGWTSLLNGDGMVYRLEFSAGEANLSAQFVKTPSHFADKITQTKYKKLKFLDLELARLSPYIGPANQVNTAFQAVKFPGDQKERLLATWDAGRAYEIDPASLQVIAPIGLLNKWQSLVKIPIDFAFKQLMTSAHPAFDPNTGELFTLNVAKSLNTIVGIGRFLPFDALRWLENKCPHLHGWLQEIVQNVIIEEIQGIEDSFDFITSILRKLGIGGKDNLFLLRWRGQEALEKWQVVGENSQPIKIRQTVHQMGISQDYIVLADTSFKIVIEDLIPAINPALAKLDKIQAMSEEIQTKELQKLFELLRKYLTYPQAKDTYVYIIKRSDLEGTDKVVAKQLTIEREFAHFLTDYDNPQNQITIHAALNPATDPGEFIHSVDTSVFSGAENTQKLQTMAGMLNNALAINRPGFYVIDGETAELKQQDIFEYATAEELKKTWYMGLYAYREEQPTRQFTDIYWLSFGAWTNIISEFVNNLYTDYQYRQTPLKDILQSTEKGVPSALNRFQIDRTAANNRVLKLADSYEFPQGYFASSPQFVPKANSSGATEGYIVCTIVYSDNYSTQNPSLDWSDNSEIWIFDAADLAVGPQYRLSSTRLNLGFTLHTTWLQEATEVPTRDYDVASDFAQSVEACKKIHSQELQAEIDQLFQEVYQDFNRDRKAE